MLANALVLSNLEYCSSIYLDAPLSSLSKLQRVMDAVFRSVHHRRKFDSISELKRKCCTLTIKQKVYLRAASIIFIALKCTAPQYIQSLLTPYSPERNLRSQNKELLACPRTNTTIGARAFSVCGPKMWNALPEHIRYSSSLTQLQNRLIASFSDATSYVI